MKRRLRIASFEDAVSTKRQHVKPCSDCPWARAAVPGWLGENTPEAWLLMAHGESVIECHTRKRPGATAGEPGAHWQCAGAAIYRSNVCKSPRDPVILRLPADKLIVFAHQQEFWDHHARRPFAVRR